MIDYITSIAIDIFTEYYITELKAHTNENEFLETITFEAVEGINSNNSEKTFKLLDLITKYSPNKEYIIKRCLRDLSYCSKTNIQIHQKYNIKFDEYALSEITSKNVISDYIEYDRDNFSSNEEMYIYLNRIYIDDDVDSFITLFEKAINNEKNSEHISDSACELDVNRLVWLAIRNAIKFEAIKIFKYFMINYDISSYDMYTTTVYILCPMVNTGNNELVHMICNTNIDVKYLHTGHVYNSHHYELIQWLNMHYCFRDVTDLDFTESLIFHFINGVNEYMSLAYVYDLSCLPIIKSEVIKNDCMNIVKSKMYKYSNHDLEIAIKNNRLELFKEMITQTDSNNAINIFLLKKAIVYSYIFNTIDFVKVILENKHEIIFQKDNSKNNVFHILFRSLKKCLRHIEKLINKGIYIKEYNEIAKKMLEYIKSLLNVGDIEKMYIEKNDMNLNVYQLAFVNNVNL